MPNRYPTVLTLCLLGLAVFSTRGARAVDDNYFVVDDLTFGSKTIDFDTDAGGGPVAAPKLFEDASPLADEYAALGIHFGSAQEGDGGCILHQDSQFGLNAHSGSNFLAFNREATTAPGGAPREPEVIRFDAPKPSVSLYVAGGFVAEAFRLDAYDAGGKLVDTSSAMANTFQPLSVASAGGISRVILSRDGPHARTTVSVPDLTGAPGGMVTIPIQVDGRALRLAGAQVSLRFDDVLGVTNASQIMPGALLANGLVESDLSSPGIVRVSAASGRGTDGPGAILLVQAKIRDDAPPGKYPLRLSDVQLSDSFGQPLLVDLVDGSLTIGQPAPPAKAVVSIPDVTGAPGGTVTIPVQVDGQAHSLAGVLVTLQFGDILAIADVSQIGSGPLLPGGLVTTNLTVPGAVTTSDVFAKGADGPGVVLLVQATVRADAVPGKYPLHLSRGELTDTHGAAIPSDLVDGSLTVGSPVPPGVCGDLDGDGKITIKDAVAALQIIVGLKVPTDAEKQATCGLGFNIGLAVHLLRVAVGLDSPTRQNPMGGG